MDLVKMKKEEKVIIFNILGEEYRITSDMDKETTIRIADYVNKQVENTKKRVGYASQTKIAVFSALNIARELFLEKDDRALLEERIKKASRKIREALVKD